MEDKKEGRRQLKVRHMRLWHGNLVSINTDK